MPSHLSFLEDAVDRFERAFTLHQAIVDNEEGRELITAANCVRELYVALEKGFKHAVATHDPYLLLVKLDRTSLLNLRRDIGSRPAPNIFCCRQPLETVGMLDAWNTLRDLKQPALQDGVLGEFERSIKLLRDMRNRAQHGELYEDIDALLNPIELVLARFVEVCEAVVPEWVALLCARNGQLRSRLKGIESKIDASWQVLVDYLRDHGPVPLPSQLYVDVEDHADKASVLLGSVDSKGDNGGILSGTDVAVSNATGLFSLFLTEQQAKDRLAARQASVLGAPDGLPPFLGMPSKPLVPLDAGSLLVPTATAWLTLVLPNIRPSRLRLLNTVLVDLRVELAATEPRGIASAVIECAVVKGTVRPARVLVNGPAFLDSEWNLAAEPGATPPSPEKTTRRLLIEWTMTVEDPMARPVSPDQTITAAGV
jgi:hypothetical protein